MKIFALFLAFAAIAAAQAPKIEVCFRATAADKTVTETCQTLPAALVSSIQQFITDQKTQIGTDGQGKPILTPKYKSPAQLVFTHLQNSLWTPLLDMFPAAPISAAKKQVDAATTALKDAKAAALPAIPDK